MARLPRRLAIAGIVIGLFLFALWELDHRYNFSHLPMVEEASTMQANYTAPPAHRFLERVTFVLCPGIVLGFFTMDMGESANAVMWLIAVAINGGVYYCLGLFLRAICKMWSSS